MATVSHNMECKSGIFFIAQQPLLDQVSWISSLRDHTQPHHTQ